MIKSLTLLATLSISSFILTGCALFSSQPEDPVVKGPVTKVINAPFDDVWRALQKAVAKYPIQTNNIDQGILETDLIKGDERFVPPYKKSAGLPNSKYQLRFNLIRGKVMDKDTVKLLVFKEITFDRDFFSGTQRQLSDGLEEKVIIYRVIRELELEKSIQKSFRRKSG